MSKQTDFALKKGIEIPKRHLFELPTCFANRYKTWEKYIDNVIALYEMAKFEYNANYQEARSCSKLAKYINVDILSFIPKPIIDFSKENVLLQIQQAIDTQKNFNVQKYCNYGDIGSKFIKKRITEIIEEMPEGKSVIVIKTDYEPGSTRKKFEKDLAYLQGKSTTELVLKDKFSTSINSPTAGLLWYAFVPNVFTPEELEQHIQSLCPSAKSKEFFIPTRLWDAKIEYL